MENNVIDESKALEAFFEKYKGNDNYGHPKKDYLKKIISMTDDELLEECKSKIWLSAYASNNSRSDYHWHCDACYDECVRRNKVNVYEKAYKHLTKD